MTTLWWVVIVVVAGGLMAFTTYAAIMGALGAVFGTRFERCPRCGRHGLVLDGPLHPYGCPHPSSATGLSHIWHALPHDLHVRHH